MDVRNMVAIITGSAQGIGKAFAEAFLKQGGKVCLVDINAIKGKETRAEFIANYGNGAVEFMECDVTKKDDIEELIPKTIDLFGRIDVVINNAGVVFGDYSDFEKCIDVNLVAMIRFTMLSLEHMKKCGGGVIVNMASAVGFVPASEHSVYAATKGGAVAYTRSLALRPELKKHNIRLHVICPWFVDTPLGTVHSKDLPPDSNTAKILNYGGMVSAEYVADAVMDLIRDTDANGIVLEVSKKYGQVRRDDIYKDLVVE